VGYKVLSFTKVSIQSSIFKYYLNHVGYKEKYAIELRAVKSCII